MSLKTRYQQFSQLVKEERLLLYQNSSIVFLFNLVYTLFLFIHKNFTLIKINVK